MAYKCIICGSSEVANPGDICELCAIGQDPYAATVGNPEEYNSASSDAGHVGRQILLGRSHAPGTVNRGKTRRVLLNGGGDLFANSDSGGDNVVPPQAPEPTVPVYHAGQLSSQQMQAATAVAPPATGIGNKTQNTVSKFDGEVLIAFGITKNISVDTQRHSFIQKWFRALFSGIPFTIDDDITMFQIFPDYTGSSLNSVGNACDQVIVYGKVNHGAIAENNEVEVYGRRDSHNNVVASKIKNKASGTTVTPERTISAAVVWAITIVLFTSVFIAAANLGSVGLIWAAILILCLTNLPRIFKVVGILFAAVFSLFKRK